ncbi:hypothetical protein [Hyphomicrobium sp. 99]|uniref:hypothetical protein n=1 Tax=Hyphomicrobium sp. 99 TaxID=1163419 RepID=UPI0005F862FF|nr:hypothetical protein [Hyphomicrobium sp. 99]
MKDQKAVDGLFEVIRTRVPEPAHASDRFILICRKGRLFGADPRGRVYMGELHAQPKHAPRRTSLCGTYRIPLRQRSPRRPAPPEPSFAIPITGEIDPFALSQNATVRVGGKEIDIQITYLGPLPRN